jgi:phosphate transport system substrate-binding protein
MAIRVAIAVAATFLSGTCAHGQDLSALPPYHPTQQVSGTIRSWGHGYLKAMMHYWEEDFQKFQPGIRFQDDLLSSAAAMAGLYSGRADLGILAREITPPEIAAYEKVTKQKIFPIQVLTGSYGDPDKIMAIGVFVNIDNPINTLTFSQLDAIFGTEHRRGARENLRTWGQLGFSGEWKQSTIQPFSGPVFEIPGYVFSQVVMKGSVLWNCNLHQFEDIPVQGGKDLDGYQRVVDAVGMNRYGIAFSGAGYRNPRVKQVALAAENGGPYIEPTKENVQNRSYPLARSVTFYINNGAAIPADPKVIEFLRYVLSREGQQQVFREGDFIPLTADIVHQELERLP